MNILIVGCGRVGSELAGILSREGHDISVVDRSADAFALLPEDFSGWAAYAVHDGAAHATTAHRTFRRMERTPEGGLLFPPEQLAAGGRCSVYAVDQPGRMRVAEVRLPAPPKPAAEPAAPQQDPSTVQPGL